MFATDELTDTGRRLASIDTRLESDEALLDATVGLSALISYAQTAQAHVLAELDVRGTTDIVHGLRTTAWAAAATGAARGPITNRLKVGRALRDHFDKIDDAISDGRLNFDHANTLCHADNPRITDILAAAQDEIITLAEASTFRSFKRDIIALAEHADADGPEPDPYEGNELHLSRTLDGHTALNGTFDPARGHTFRSALETKTDELFRRFTHDHNLTPDLPIPGRNTLRALALEELIRTAVGADQDTGSLPRAEVTLVAHNHDITDPDGTPMPRAATDVWGCDPEIWAVVVDHMGIPVDVGHTHRLATIAQRRAIAIRDGGCTFPGCDAPPNWCDHHHVTDWHLGGPTDLANLVALCRHHHGVTHRTGWAMTLDDHQVPHWTSPTGDHLTGHRHHRRRADTGPPDTGPPDTGPPD